LEWHDEVEAMKMAMSSPPYFLVNVRNEKTYRMLRYVTRGQIDMDDSTMASCKLFVNEIISYWTSYCYVVDVVAGILLWRGRWHLRPGISIWFPIDSFALFVAAVVCVERVDLILPILLIAIAWILVSIKYHLSRKAYPWKRVKSVGSMNLVVLAGGSLQQSLNIAPNVGVEEGKKDDLLDELKAKRMSLIIWLWLSFMLNVYRIYSKSLFTGVKITTTEKDGFRFLADRLYYIHLLLKYICQYARMFRTFMSWRTYSTHIITMRCFMFGTMWLLFPVGTILLWMVRLVVWTLLGPWMKFVDMYWVHPVYQTKEELQQMISQAKEEETIESLSKRLPLPDFDSLLASKTFRQLSYSGRVNAENLYKLKAMRCFLFGEYSDMIPIRDPSGQVTIPLPASQATSRKEQQKHQQQQQQQQSNEKDIWYHVHGQELHGNMIMNVGSQDFRWCDEDDDHAVL
jgi:hypothetical protein